METTDKHCTFCGKLATYTRTLHQGREGSAICDECVLLMVEMLPEDVQRQGLDWAIQRWGMAAPPPSGGP